ncbi:hypothetical protein Q5H94_15010 [Sphingomonas sp. CA1-15]|uniref:Uncharacterized protein n=1 Tax=Sphingomonas immobilis TaxID=3063997 RepID=A0ABT9A1D6_9SPHN|nr:hypothetical protein [Sphingomonas sp. CA1-15]
MASPVATTPLYEALLLGAVRARAAAREARQPIQVALSQLPALGGAKILSPVLDSLVRFYEAALGRRMTIGSDAAASGDESLLLDLVGCRTTCAEGLECSAAAGAGLDCALCSTRVMLMMSAE